MKTLLIVIPLLLTLAAIADQPTIVYSNEAEGSSFSLRKSVLNPGIAQIVITLPAGTTSVGLILRGAEGEFISSSALQTANGKCTVILAESSLQNSSIVTPYIAESEGDMVEFYFGMTRQDQAKNNRTATETKKQNKSEMATPRKPSD